MAFWKKSEDPWDRKPEKQRTAPEPAETEAPVLQSEAEISASMACPWCGSPMLKGELRSTGRGLAGMCWNEGPSRSFLESFGATDQPGRLELGISEEAWYCTACRKLVLDVGAALKRGGPNYVWKNGKVVVPDDTDSEEREP